MPMRSKWCLLGAGACLLQLTNCVELAQDTAYRIGFDLFFLPINNALVSVFQLV
jgi:hypothetical protein